MEDKITTSAQKTTALSQKEVLKTLIEKIGKQENIKFEKTNKKELFVGTFKDNSKLYVASFNKDNGKTIAMIDNKGVNKEKRKERQVYWKKTLDQLFNSDLI